MVFNPFLADSACPFLALLAEEVLFFSYRRDLILLLERDFYSSPIGGILFFSLKEGFYSSHIGGTLFFSLREGFYSPPIGEENKIPPLRRRIKSLP